MYLTLLHIKCHMLFPIVILHKIILGKKFIKILDIFKKVINAICLDIVKIPPLRISKSETRGLTTQQQPKIWV